MSSEKPGAEGLVVEADAESEEAFMRSMVRLMVDWKSVSACDGGVAVGALELVVFVDCVALLVFGDVGGGPAPASCDIISSSCFNMSGFDSRSCSISAMPDCS